DAVARQRRDVGLHRAGKREIDCHVDAAPAVQLGPAGMERRLRIDDANHLAPVLGRQVADQTPHATVTNQQDSHQKSTKDTKGVTKDTKVAKKDTKEAKSPPSPG